jgi:hypothetical protein
MNNIFHFDNRFFDDYFRTEYGQQIHLDHHAIDVEAILLRKHFFRFFDLNATEMD